jgi:hypothetical protein
MTLDNCVGPAAKLAMSGRLSEVERRRLEAQFREQVRLDCEESERIGFPPRAFRRMVADVGPVEACIRVIMAPKIPDGFLKLLEFGRLDLTAEATILRKRWRALFENRNDVLEQARNRLLQYNRPDLVSLKKRIEPHRRRN